MSEGIGCGLDYFLLGLGNSLVAFRGGVRSTGIERENHPRIYFWGNGHSAGNRLFMDRGFWRDRLMAGFKKGTGIARAVDLDLTTALFATFEHLPFTGLISFASILLILTFLVTSADSATYILASMTTYGSLHPRCWQKLCGAYSFPP